VSFLARLLHIVSSRHPRFGGNSQHLGEDVGVWELCPQRGPGPGAEPLVMGSGGEAPEKLEAFCCISSLFWSILEGIVEL